MSKICQQTFGNWKDEITDQLVSNCDKGLAKCRIMQTVNNFRLLVDRLTGNPVSDTLELQRRIQEHKLELEKLKSEIIK